MIRDSILGFTLVGIGFLGGALFQYQYGEPQVETHTIIHYVPQSAEAEANFPPGSRPDDVRVILHDAMGSSFSTYMDAQGHFIVRCLTEPHP
jgi:hypothetical protein